MDESLIYSYHCVLPCVSDLHGPKSRTSLSEVFMAWCHSWQFSLSVPSDPGNFFATIIGLTRIEVDDRHLESTVQEAWFLCW